MTIRQIKAASGLPPQAAQDTADTVQVMLARIRAGGEDAARDYAQRLDGWDGPALVQPEAIARACDAVPEGLKADIRYAHDNIRRFAEAQRATLTEMEVELRPGLFAGQRVIPVGSVGAYVPGGRYAHIASALMTIASARAAGVAQITACSPPRGDQGIPAPILYAMHLAGADRILCMGGVQGVAAMAFGLFGGRPADILVGPGNQYVAEAKRQLFGPVGIDMVAGPTDSLILADDSADALTVAWDLVGQAEHGANSPVWLVASDAALAEAVMEHVPICIAALPEPNRTAARDAWEALGEVWVCDTPEDMAQKADEFAPEHLHVQARDLDWWQGRLRNYGSLFLGANTTVPFGDKAAGPNHVLPTSGAARHTGGLSVLKYLKTVTWQRVEDRALPELARVSASISRHEGMEGHARSAEMRLPRPPSTLKAVG
ncbi:histidinol dehydrogenase [Lutimaribacter saemankumensis]|uniref:Histidinol dehydrogenase homolog n=1 Tax=Lutimaribacter saemankumensis TaxID=490829 RepID=A0A1G8M9E5_9RHOB|nr:histidinol dehydrogenase [Lutimaribacter saemankumensis]SDI64586.1 sulfopropanediol 3-dehydrogenase [Lutimaribacter saemankumensis]